jgi:hypothetical protein
MVGAVPALIAPNRRQAKENCRGGVLGQWKVKGLVAERKSDILKKTAQALGSRRGPESLGAREHMR